jgi:hypothetical protein
LIAWSSTLSRSPRQWMMLKAEFRIVGELRGAFYLCAATLERLVGAP